MKYQITRLSLLSLAAGILLISCQKDENNSSDLPLISGIFKTNALPLNDSLSTTLFFTFDELANGSINGGVRLTLAGENSVFQKYKYKSLHELGLWQKGTDGTTLIEGETDLGFDVGTFGFSGSISSDSIFSFNVINDTITISGEAFYAAPYLNSSSKTTLKMVDTANYVGDYPLTCFEPLSNNLNTFTSTICIFNQYSDGMGGYNLVGEFGEFSINYSIEPTFGGASDVLAGDLYIENYQLMFIIQTQPFAWNPDVVYTGFSYMLEDYFTQTRYIGQIQIDPRQ
ncbi:MAG: hypothetical protein HOJ19_00935 [Candidatus Marinimicrobia bacterium]|nr:hypothetical protein [Chloroflexota bacterium]MBT6301885.1 hypothetical protein [Candidatus Neomarinimicrobiota bacterium]